MLQAALLGLIQGLTEFLPVSSSGHLTLLGNWLGTRDEDVSFELFLHSGTLLATAIVFWRPLTELIVGILKREKTQTRLGLLILVTTLVTGILGKLFESPLEKMFRSPLLVCFMLIVTGVLLYLPKIFRTHRKAEAPMSYPRAAIVGLIQAFAIIPGISRSGATISGCLLLGWSRKTAGEYSFLISIPIIAAASLVKIPETLTQPHHFSGVETGFGVLVAFISGLAALKFLLVFVHRGKLHYFSWYCWALGSIGLFLLYR